MNVAVFGLGYVGATNAACLAKLGHSIVGIDVNEGKVATLAAGRSPIAEPQVPELLQSAYAAGRLRATTSPDDALDRADLAFVCVGTPSRPDGSIEPRFLLRVTEQIAAFRKRSGRTIPIFVRSTSLPTVHRMIVEGLSAAVGDTQPAAYCVHPEFLREGQAVDDFFNPPKIVYGVTDNTALRVIPDIYPDIDAPTEVVDINTAALVKYADNCFHALKVTFANEIGRLARTFDVDAREIMRIFCLDERLNISTRYLRPGLPFGGSCLPKDLRAVDAWSREAGIQLPVLNEIMRSNQLQIMDIVERIAALPVRKVALIGLAFKDDTDDLRESPMLAMFAQLRARGFDVWIFDPVADQSACNRLAAQDAAFSELPRRLTSDGSKLVQSSDLVVIARAKVGIDFKSLTWAPGARVFDLVGVELPLHRDQVTGLYW